MAGGYMTNNADLKLSRRMCLALRHKPEAFDITLDSEGWVDIRTLAIAMNTDAATIRRIMAEDDKGRYEGHQSRNHTSPNIQLIRCVQGHSTPQVNIQFTEQQPPDCLYHGTATSCIDSIRRDGINPMSRQYVHLSGDKTTAVSVGARHGSPVVMCIDAKQMAIAGYKFFLSVNGVWLTTKVPSEFITRMHYPTPGTFG